MHDSREDKDHTRWRKLDLGQRSSEEDEKVKFEVFLEGEKRETIERDRRRMIEKSCGSNI